MPTNEGAFRSFSGLHFFLHAVQKVKLCQAQKNNQSFCCVFLQQSVPLHKVLDDMAQGRPIKVAFMDEVEEFLDTLDEAPRDKIIYNVKKVAGGVIDSDLFKKLDGSSDIWEFRTKYNGMEYRLLAFWDEQEKRLLWLLMDLSRRHGKFLPRKLPVPKH